MNLITPVEDLNKISSLLGISLKVKRDDLFPFSGGGNKARKIQYIFREAVEKNANALVTAGSANSNHARVVAIFGAQKGWPVHIIIHDNEDYSNGNLQLMRLAGAKLSFVEKEHVSMAMDNAIHDFSNKGYNPLYIKGGGHSIQGMMAYYDAVAEYLDQTDNWWPDYVIHASGTGGTQAGLHVGFSEHLSKTKIIGISVARKKNRGKKIVEDSVSELCSYLNIPNKSGEVYFLDDWTGKGYESVYPELIESIKKTAQLEGLITDPTYTGKAMTALFELCKKDKIEKKSRVLFWHTGGLINLLKHDDII